VADLEVVREMDLEAVWVVDLEAARLEAAGSVAA
jgi:hypothetical protein